jgi:hypothetical protein
MTARERRLALIVGGLAAFIVAWKLVASPLWAWFGGLRERTASAVAAIETEEAVSARADDIKARDARLYSVKDLSDVGTVEAAFLGFVSRSAQEAGVAIASERPSTSARLPRPGRGACAEVQVSLTGRATLDAYVKFLDALSRSDRPLRVVAASLSRTDAAGALAVNMRLSTVAVREESK